VAAFIAIDPATYQTGVAYFNGSRLVDHWLITVKQGTEIEERIKAIVGELEKIAVAHSEIREVVCEKLPTMSGRAPSPEVVTLIRRLKKWATKGTVTQGHRFVWSEYHPSTIVASVRPRGFNKPGESLRDKSSKELMALGVNLLYSVDANVYDQNVIDAIAVGHCHVSKTYEAELLSNY